VVSSLKLLQLPHPISPEAATRFFVSSSLKPWVRIYRVKNLRDGYEFTLQERDLVEWA